MGYSAPYRQTPKRMFLYEKNNDNIKKLQKNCEMKYILKIKIIALNLADWLTK